MTAAPGDEAFPLYGAEFKQCPYPTYEQLREKGPVHQVKFPSGVIGWLVTGYEAALKTLSDPRLGKDHSLGNDRWRELAAIMPEPQHSQMQVHLLHRDAPKHTTMRKPVLDALAPRIVEQRRPRIEQIAEQLLDGIAPAGRAELVGQFAAPFSFAVLSEAIGLPAGLQAKFRREWCSVVQPVGPASPLRSRYTGLLEGLQAYIVEVVADKRERPGDDLLTRLVELNAAGGITDEELTSTVFQLLVAGQEPVTHQICMALITLLTHPEQLEQVRSGAVAIDKAIEETFRYDGSFELTTWRFFAEDSDLFGTRIPAGDSVIVALGAANRDPARFPDPDELDLTRSPNPHLGFGHGAHFCPGATLGRIEVQTAVAAVLRRLPDLRPALPVDELDWVQAVLTRGFNQFPVRFTPSTVEVHDGDLPPSPDD